MEANFFYPITRQQNILIEFKQDESVNESYQNHESGYIIGTISLKKLQEIQNDESIKKSFVLLEIAKQATAKPIIAEWALSALAVN